jgi:hypothetical protein
MNTSDKKELRDLRAELVDQIAKEIQEEEDRRIFEAMDMAMGEMAPEGNLRVWDKKRFHKNKDPSRI